MNQWAYCNGKIYQKFNRARGSIDSNIIIHYKSSVGMILNVIHPEYFEVENRFYYHNSLN